MEKLKVAGIEYRIQIKELVDNDPNTYGSCVYHDAHIEIRKGLSKERTEQTFVHELMHATIFEAGYRGDEYEELVERLSVVLHQVIKENDLPRLLEQISLDTERKRGL